MAYGRHSVPNGPISTHDWGKYINLASPGAIAEFGCYDGGSTRLLAGMGRPVFAFDTFQGIPKEDYNASEDGSNPPGKFAPTTTVKELFRGHNNIYPVVGRYADTLPTVGGLQFAFAYIDCDLYESYKQVLNYIAPRMIGDYFMCDDYHDCTGARRAVDEWVAGQTDWRFDKSLQVFSRVPKVCPLCGK